MGDRKVKKKSLKRKLSDFWESFCDRARYTLVAIYELWHNPKYLSCFIISFLAFLFILSFFKDGDSNWQLLWSGLTFERKMAMLGQVCLGILTNFVSWSGLALIFMSLLQALVVMLLIFAWRQHQRESVIDGASTGGIGAIFGFIALGCPSCGVGLLTPILTTIAGAGAMAMAETVSNIFTILALILLFYTVIKLGYINYVTISAAKATKKEEKTNAKSN